MGLNVNTSDSEFLNQPESSKDEVCKKGSCECNPEKPKGVYRGDARGKKEDGYVVIYKGQKIRKWVDADGKWQEEILK